MNPPAPPAPHGQPTSAIVLFAHGARDARWGLALERLKAALDQRGVPGRLAVAFLELQAPGLAQTLEDLAAQGISHIDIAPIFWSRGGHITRDLAQLVEDFRSARPGISVRVLPVLAEIEGMNDFVAQAILAQAQQPPSAAAAACQTTERPNMVGSCDIRLHCWL